MKIVFICLLWTLWVTSFAQQADSIKMHEDLRFARYLTGSGQYADVIQLLDRLDLSRNDLPYRDSLNYLKGWSFYSIKSLDSASLYFLRTSLNSPIGIKSRFFSAYNSIYLRNYDAADHILFDLTPPDSQLTELKHLEFAGMALLNRDYPAYESIKKNFTYKWYSLLETEEKLNQYQILLSARKIKSPWKAGIMSMIIPGTGKMYAGKIGEGVSALLSNAILLGITCENYRKQGPQSFKTIFFGSLFTIFYIGNIYGSMISVQVSNSEFNTIYDNKILLDIHIPLRTIFN